MEALNTTRLNETFELLTHPHRRYVMYHLASESEGVGIETLATAIADWNQDHPESGRATDFKSIKTALYHTHLPKLADAGYITVDPAMDSIALATPDELDPFLAEAAPIDDCGQPVVSAD